MRTILQAIGKLSWHRHNRGVKTWEDVHSNLYFVAKGERSRPTRILTRVYRIQNMHSDRNAKVLLGHQGSSSSGTALLYWTSSVS